MTVARAGVVAAVGAVVLTGCGGAAHHSMARTSPAGTQSRPAIVRSAGPRPALLVQRWGVNDGMLSLLVKNTTTKRIRSAHVVITARDRSGSIIASVSGPNGSLCCTVVDLAPGATFGLYTDFGPGVARAAAVSVDSTEVHTAQAPAAPAVTATAPTLISQNGVTTVSAELSSRTSTSPYVAVQASLITPASGNLVAVISGRFYCLFPGKRLRVRLQLFHPVPAGTIVESVRAFQVPTDGQAVTAGLPSCTAG